MNLYSSLQEHFPNKTIILTEKEIKYLEDEPFMTESCGDCSYLRWGHESLDGKLKEDEDYGEIPCCSDGDSVWAMAKAPDADSLTPEDALEWYFGRHETPKQTCERYDGEIKYTRKYIEDWIKKRDSIIKKISGLDNLEQFKEYTE